MPHGATLYTIGAILLVIAVVTFIGAVWLLVKLVRMRRRLHELGTGGKVAFYGALIYTICPFDLLPDPIYLDDMAVLAAATAYLGHLWRQRQQAHQLPRLPDPRQTSRK
jgi:hypothetical protein